ncbi:hypothetical protein [uncultured Oscillibacter sp.]|uniref:hypothetical protein n=1 Tax=uncultured Oscillibacter sp. TaxID=876091 RepID=UPI00261FCA4D|nr:hypothetical protein [uncultured Oscillibacter sp.]
MLGLGEHCLSGHVEGYKELLAELYMRQMVEAGKDWGKNQPAAFSEEEMQKKRAQVRGLQAALISQQGGE